MVRAGKAQWLSQRAAGSSGSSVDYSIIPKYASALAAAAAGLALWSVFRINDTLAVQNMASLFTYTFSGISSLQMPSPPAAVTNLKNASTWTVEGWFYPQSGFSSGSESYVIDTRSASGSTGFGLSFMGISNTQAYPGL